MINKFSTQSLEEACKYITRPVRNDKHLESIYTHFDKTLLEEGKIKLPRRILVGWYSKNYDIVFSDENGKHAIELKSISGSFGKNFNNRVEEMTGQALLSKKVLGLSTLSYVFVINEIRESINEKYVKRLKECATTLINCELLKNFVLLRVKEASTSYEGDFNFEKWDWQ